MKKKYRPLIFSIIVILAGIFNALALMDRVRLVDILTLFFTGFGAGAGLVKTILNFREDRRTKVQVDHLK